MATINFSIPTDLSVGGALTVATNVNIGGSLTATSTSVTNLTATSFINLDKRGLGSDANLAIKADSGNGSNINFYSGSNIMWRVGRGSGSGANSGSDKYIIWDETSLLETAVFSITGLAVTGTLGVTGSLAIDTGTLSQTISANGTARNRFRNSDAGSGAYCIIDIGNDVDSFLGEIFVTSSTNGNYSGAGTFNILTTTALGIHISGVEKARFTSTGLAITGVLSSTGIGAIGTSISSTTNFNLAAGTTGVSSLRIPHGSAPTSPVNGDVWTTTTGLFVRINGVTVGPLT